MMRTLPFIALLCAAAASVSAQPQPGKVERVVVHGKALEGNLEGDSPDRDVAVYLPPSYGAARNQRYPVVYMLHGFTDDVDHWWGVKPHFVSLPAVIDKALAGGKTREMIVVMPNAFTRYQGSMYSTSVTTGDWENFVASELVAYIDSHYRTIPGAASRGLAGHSMGGYGAIRIGMKHPEVFSSVYLLSPCCMAASMQPGGMAMPQAEAIRNPAEVDKANFFVKATLASAAAWSPNPKNPPLYFDLPSKNGEFQPAIAAKWAANAPLAILDQYIPNLKRLHAITFDAGAQDAAIASTIKLLDGALNAYEIRHAFEIYEGTHINRIAERIETKTLPFFSANLSFTPTKR
jgi:S-formylglutathione hydrolase FrmB